MCWLVVLGVCKSGLFEPRKAFNSETVVLGGLGGGKIVGFSVVGLGFRVRREG
jgi:hypothetical protein